ncbi:MAG: AmmeMemoRadiSam system protein B [Patescibacteria group bacterium]
MPLIFSAIAPHPPIIIPEIGKGEETRAQKTIDALKELEGELYMAKPDTIFIISPHSPISPDSFSLNLSTDFHNPETKLNFNCDVEMISKIKEMSNNEFQNIPVNIITEPKLDHGVCVPLYFLTQHLPQIKIVPISFCLLDNISHVEFGKLLHTAAQLSNKRIAIIASGDLSHSASTPQGKTFDHTLQKLLVEKDFNGIIKLRPDLITKANECGYRSILILLGALDDLNITPKIYSYEAPFDVGYLVAEFSLK